MFNTERAYEKYMPKCSPSCPSTGCYKSFSGNILTYQCVECELTSTVDLDALPTVVLEDMLSEMTTVSNNMQEIEA